MAPAVLLDQMKPKAPREETEGCRAESDLEQKATLLFPTLPVWLLGGFSGFPI